MIRHCDGTDPNLVKHAPDCHCNRCIHCPDGFPSEPVKTVPCDCGKTFDDVNHLVLYPHHKF